MMKWVLSWNGLPVDSKFSGTNNVLRVMATPVPQALAKVSLKLSLLPSNGRSVSRFLKKIWSPAVEKCAQTQSPSLT